jgi:hypothetical protein
MLDRVLKVRCSGRLSKAVQAAAASEGISGAQFARLALLESLRARGVVLVHERGTGKQLEFFPSAEPTDCAPEQTA